MDESHFPYWEQHPTIAVTQKSDNEEESEIYRFKKM